MVVAKIYWAAWLFVAVLASTLYLTDTFTSAAMVVLGFIASVLTGAGMLVVYPALMNEDIGLQRTRRIDRPMRKRGVRAGMAGVR